MASRRAPSPPRPLRGEIWEFDLRPRKGREQRGICPCIVVSTDALNRSKFGTAIICPLTTTERPTFAWRVGLQPSDIELADPDWEPRPSWVQTDQLLTVDTSSRARRHLSTVVAAERMEAVDDSLRLMLAL